MRPRFAGRYEPDDANRRELVELWHLSRTACSGGDRYARLEWLTGEFLRAHAADLDVPRKRVFAWAEANLGGIAMVDRRESSYSGRSRRRIVADMSWLGPPPPK